MARSTGRFVVGTHLIKQSRVRNGAGIIAARAQLAAEFIASLKGVGLLLLIKARIRGVSRVSSWLRI
jgi:hypothetical protein